MQVTAEKSDISVPAPIVVDLGKNSRKQVKQLRQGKGKLMDKALECIQELKTAGKISNSAQPVVIVVRQRSRRRKLWPLA